jgi:Holliday junction resolvase RusA-like endonuclease
MPKPPTQTTIEFTVLGRPQQRGSKSPWIPKHKDGSMVMRNGRPVIATRDSNVRSKAWMDSVRSAAMEAVGFDWEPLRCPIMLDVEFHFARPQAHFGTGKNAERMKPSAPMLFTQSPDLSKLIRALEDAMTGIIYVDDRQIFAYSKCLKKWTQCVECALVMVHANSEAMLKAAAAAE